MFENQAVRQYASTLELDAQDAKHAVAGTEHGPSGDALEVM